MGWAIFRVVGGLLSWASPDFRQQVIWVQGGIPWGDLERYGTFWMAGAAAESLHYDQVTGDEQDWQQLRMLLSGIPSVQPLTSPAKVKAQMNRYLRQSQALLQAHLEAYAVTVQHLERGSPWEDCLAAIAESLEQKRPQEV
ncbi:MAG: hypothetical protein Q6L60_00255 [Thermostichus sp. HHBFW_bins_43]